MIRLQRVYICVWVHCAAAPALRQSGPPKTNTKQQTCHLGAQSKAQPAVASAPLAVHQTGWCLPCMPRWPTGVTTYTSNIRYSPPYRILNAFEGICGSMQPVVCSQHAATRAMHCLAGASTVTELSIMECSSSVRMCQQQQGEVQASDVIEVLP